MSARHVGIIRNPAKVEAEILDAAVRAATIGREPPRITTFETSREDPGVGATQRALAAGADLVVAAGGDGTVRAVVETLARRGAPADMGVVPMGTGNLLARNLGIPLHDPAAAFALALDGSARPIDIGWVEVALEDGPRRYAFASMTGIGVDAHMIEQTDESLKKRIGWLAYIAAMGPAISASAPVDVDLLIDGRTALRERAHTVMVGNVGIVQGGLNLLPDASAEDGRLDLLILGENGVTGWVDTVRNLVWDNGVTRILTGREESVDSRTATRRPITTLEVRLSEERMFELDGEPIGRTRSLRFEVQPAALRLRC
ncbi:diacylglycerol/lipid kinase family protein [Brachybacterium phenoliresistens]|uniref:diacylglycerol/lipid kinase family protein n=1 Tax=Brachybacterium phenoliresistens TaxID=396014 RepID=UPI0031E09297